MPIRTATLSKQIQKNGAKLHVAMLARVHSQGADHEASETEQALLEERRSLKEAAEQRRAQAAQPREKAPSFIRTHHPTAKAPKAPKEHKEHKEKDAKSKAAHKPSRSEKVAKKAENLEAAKKAAKKSAKT
jgi:hypothetical protein